jgi:AraC family transcriptional regulator
MQPGITTEFAANWEAKPQAIGRTSDGLEVSRWKGSFEAAQEFPCTVMPFTVVAVHENTIFDHTLITEGREVRRADIRAGAIQIVPASVEASGRCAPGPYVFHHVQIPDEALLSVASDMEKAQWELIDPRYDRHDPLLVGLAGRLNASLASTELVEKLRADELGHGFVTRLLSAYCAWPVTRTHHALSAWRLKRVLDYIEDRLPRPMELAELARIGGYSVSHFRAGFQRAMGCSPSTYVMRRRVICAQMSLAKKTLSLSRIATDCGFVDQAHFTRRFRATTGVTPAQYRKDRS